MTEAKATARHEKMARSKKEKVEELRFRISTEQSSYGKKKADGKQRIKELPKEERPAAKAALDTELAGIKANIAKLKEELKEAKAAVKADEAKSKEAKKAQ